MYAQAYDNPIPGYDTKNVANLRLFEATPVTEFDLDAFNEGQYEKAILQVGEASLHKQPYWDSRYQQQQRGAGCGLEEVPGRHLVLTEGAHLRTLLSDPKAAKYSGRGE